MSESIAVIIELLVFLCALWVLSFLSTLLHELGHALGYMLATGDGHWHIRVGWGKRLLNTKALTVNLLVFDGFFSPSEKKIDTKGKLITTLSGGPAVSLLLVLGLLILRFGGRSFQSDYFADGAIESFLNSALSINLCTLILSVAPIHYFHGEMKGTESDGLQIIHALKKDGD
ncbi:MAG: hypothetical protein IKO68_10525 [Oscillospiraceae bacterium]|nr:hypothetical protein [Oscillospiraceae bacterium]